MTNGRPEIPKTSLQETLLSHIDFIKAGNLFLAAEGSGSSGIDLSRDPNWNVIPSISPGRPNEQRLYLDFSNGRDGKQFSWVISSRVFNEGRVFFDQQEGILWIQSPWMGANVSQAVTGQNDKLLALRVSADTMTQSEKRLLEGILTLVANDGNYQLARFENPVIAVAQAERIKPNSLKPAPPSSPLPPQEEKQKEKKEKIYHPKIDFATFNINGRSEEDYAGSLSPEDLRNNRWGIFFLGGVLDGHSEERGQTQIGKTALSTFWRFLKNSSAATLKEAINEASARTDEELIINQDWNHHGVCVELAMATPEGLTFVHLGDGQVFQRKSGQTESLNLKPHHPEGGAVAGRINVNRSWGDGDVKKIVGTNVLSPIPDIVGFSWQLLKQQGVTEILLTTDGLIDLMTYANRPDLAAEAIEGSLDTPFQNQVIAAMTEFNQRYPRPGADDVSGLLLTLHHPSSPF